MPKKFGTNSKAEEGRARKEAQKEVKRTAEQRKKQEHEEREWSIGAKTKSGKQINEEAKKVKKFERKKEREMLEAQEAAEMAKYKPLKPLPKEKSAQTRAMPVMEATKSQPNITSAASSPRSGEEGISYAASNIDDALFLLSSTTDVSKVALERHPERRVKAAYAAFEARELPILKAEFPSLRLSQLKEKLYEAWKRSPDNPFNQAHISHRATKSQELLAKTEDINARLELLRIPPS